MSEHAGPGATAPIEALCPLCLDGVTLREAVAVSAARWRGADCPVCGDVFGKPAE